jgi:hypothetical protein
MLPNTVFLIWPDRYRSLELRKNANYYLRLKDCQDSKIQPKLRQQQLRLLRHHPRHRCLRQTLPLLHRHLQTCHFCRDHVDHQDRRLHLLPCVHHLLQKSHQIRKGFQNRPVFLIRQISNDSWLQRQPASLNKPIQFSSHFSVAFCQTDRDRV